MIVRPLALLLHVAVVVLAPLADARLERDVLSVGLHVESEDSRACPPGHDHLLCQICRVLGGSLAPAAGPTGAAAPHRFAAGLVRGVDLPTAAHPGFLPLGPRAPPVV